MSKHFNNFLIRSFDIILSFILLILISPLFICVLLIIFFQDFNNPFYIAKRVGKDNKIFNMFKLRTMIVNADKTGVDSTADDDQRITSIGNKIRKYKLDEIPQIFNVLIGQMSFVGPRPNVLRETELYSQEEKKLLSVRPGITDFASICFSDEGEILKGSKDPDIDYNQLIRPGKNYLGLFYISHRSLMLNISLIILTALAIVNKKKSRDKLVNLLSLKKAPDFLLQIVERKNKLKPLPPPGMNKIVTSRNNPN